MVRPAQQMEAADIHPPNSNTIEVESWGHATIAVKKAISIEAVL